MSVSMPSMSDLNDRARNALIKEFGAVEAMRYLNQFRVGSGNYAPEREKSYTGEMVKSIAADIKARRLGLVLELVL